MQELVNYLDTLVWEDANGVTHRVFPKGFGISEANQSALLHFHMLLQVSLPR